jgi:hypothetical protein
MGQPWFRLGQEYANGQHGNAKTVGLGELGRRSTKVTATAANDEVFALAA